MNVVKKLGIGIIIGVSSITPGVSGSMIAASFNIYESLIDALNLFSKKPIKAVFSIWEYLIGIIIGIFLGVLLITQLLKLIPLYIIVFFMGLILGSIHKFVKVEKTKPKKWYHFLVLSLAIVLVGLSIFIQPTTILNLSNFQVYFLYIFIGLAIALPMITPGLSSATILMILGVYTFFTNLVNDILINLSEFQIIPLFKSILPVFIIMVITFLGVILLAKFIKYILNNHRTSFNMAIIGLLIISPLNVIVSINREIPNLFENINAFKIIISVVLLVLGFLLAVITSDFKEEESNETESNL